MASLIKLPIICFLLLLAVTSVAAQFRCSSRVTCSAVIDYAPRNATTFIAVQRLFGVKNLRSLLGANNLPLSTPPNQTLPASQTLRIPFQCLCLNGTGVSNRRPMYKVAPGDGLFHIAADVFSGLVTYPQIQVFNNVSDPNRIAVGQELWIPLPCSCDAVGGQTVMHYGHVVASGSTIEGIAQRFGTTANTLLGLNGLARPNDLKAGAVLDVPLRACSSTVSNNSLDYPFLVPNGTYAFTAANCVMCSCDAANNWVLQCQPSGLRSALWPSCPSMQCQGSESLYIGNTTSSASNCDSTTCSYAGYTNQTILTTLAVDSTCPAFENLGWTLNLPWWNWNFLFVSIHLVFIYLHHLFH